MIAFLRGGKNGDPGGLISLFTPARRDYPAWAQSPHDTAARR